MTNVPQARRPSGLAGWLLNLPARFERMFPRAGKWALFALVILLLLLSIPLIVTPLTVWQQTIVAVMLIAIGWFTVRLEHQQTQQQASEYLHLFLAWLSVVTTLRYVYYRTNYTLNLDS
ncbi:MAG: hypothetical protein F6K28_42855 [Microcoleus sp. SIO2G3]|nr:hypothetical protein [Microcoleus sp. SIO2G3]